MKNYLNTLVAILANGAEMSNSQEKNMQNDQVLEEKWEKTQEFD